MTGGELSNKTYQANRQEFFFHIFAQVTTAYANVTGKPSYRTFNKNSSRNSHLLILEINYRSLLPSLLDILSK